MNSLDKNFIYNNNYFREKIRQDRFISSCILMIKLLTLVKCQVYKHIKF